jgi:hypothetical protein
MQSAHPKPILNTSLPVRFRQICIELAREHDHPEGDAGVAYVIVAPLDRSDRIDPILWREHREACRIARLRRDKEDEHGRLVHSQGGGWAFHYDAGVNTPDEVGFHFENQRFLAGEYVSINDAGKMHTYRVVSVNRL